MGCLSKHPLVHANRCKNSQSFLKKGLADCKQVLACNHPKHVGQGSLLLIQAYLDVILDCHLCSAACQINCLDSYYSWLHWSKSESLIFSLITDVGTICSIQAHTLGNLCCTSVWELNMRGFFHLVDIIGYLWLVKLYPDTQSMDWLMWK